MGVTAEENIVKLPGLSSFHKHEKLKKIEQEEHTITYWFENEEHTARLQIPRDKVHSFSMWVKERETRFYLNKEEYPEWLKQIRQTCITALKNRERLSKLLEGRTG